MVINLMGQPSHPSKDYQNSLMGKKVPQVGGNMPTAPKPGKVTGNTPDAGKAMKETGIGGNYAGPNQKPGL